MKRRNPFVINPMFLSEGAIERAVKKYEKQSKKCLLPGCEKLTKHNGGYCCPEHCKEHRNVLKVSTK